MAKYTITYACGHTDTIELYGSHSDREDRIAYLEKNGKCKECWKADKIAEAKRNASQYPTLTGSEKQVAWAIDIRKSWVKEIELELSGKGLTLSAAIEKFSVLPEAKKQELLNMSVSNLLCKLAHVLTETSARYYIDNRNN